MFCFQQIIWESRFSLYIMKLTTVLDLGVELSHKIAVIQLNWKPQRMLSPRASDTQSWRKAAKGHLLEGKAGLYSFQRPLCSQVRVGNGL